MHLQSGKSVFSRHYSLINEVPNIKQPERKGVFEDILPYWAAWVKEMSTLWYEGMSLLQVASQSPVSLPLGTATSLCYGHLQSLKGSIEDLHKRKVVRIPFLRMSDTVKCRTVPEPGYNFKALSCTPTYLNRPISQFPHVNSYEI